MSNHKKAEKDYLKGMKYKELAEKYDVSINTIKSWKQRHNWNRKSVHTNEKVCTQKQGAPLGNKNALGNKGGAAPKGNQNAVKHGLFVKIFPDDDETMAIVEEIMEKKPLDILWEQIIIQYTAIARSQKIMHVKNQEDMTKIKSMDSSGMQSDTVAYMIQMAWDKQANFLKAQSRAMETIQKLIKQYDELLNSGLATEEQKARIEMLKSKIPNRDTVDMNKQITALADLINNPQERALKDD